MLKRLAAIWVVGLAALLLPATIAEAESSFLSPSPEGFKVTAREKLAEGLEHLTLIRNDPPLAIHIAQIAPQSAVSMRVVLSNEAVFGPEPRKELTSSMCIRVECVVAVNGDFSVIETGEPLGAVIIGGEMVRSPNEKHHQLTVAPDSSLSSGPLQWTGRLMPSNLKEIAISGVNVARQDGQLILYTPAWGPSTETNQYGTEIVAEVVDPAPPLRLGQTARVRLVELRDAQGNTQVPPGGLVLSGHGPAGEVLKNLWTSIEAGAVARDAFLRLETNPDGAESVGGTPVLVREGKRWFANEATSLVRDRHPRTLAGWNSDRWVWLVTVDGRQPGYSVGMTLAEAADFMIALGATEAINLDGGGSTTFVVGGRVVNQPSDRAVRRGGGEAIVSAPQAGDRVLGNVERPRPVALALIPKPGEALLKSKTPSGDFELPRRTQIRLPAPAADPASVPTGVLPAYVERTAEGMVDLRVVALSINAVLSLIAAVITLRRRAPLHRSTPAASD